MWERKTDCDDIYDLSVDGQGTVIVCDPDKHRLSLYNGSSGDVITDNVSLVIPGRSVSKPLSVCVYSRDRVLLMHKQTEGERTDWAVSLWHREGGSLIYIRDVIQGFRMMAGYVCIRMPS